MRLRNLILGTFAATAVMAGGVSANAATIITPVSSGVFSLGNPTGTISALKVLSANSYDFTFTTNGTYDVLLQMQASMFKLGAQKISFSLYSGTPAGAHSLLDSVAYDFAPSMEKVLGAGNYYLTIDKIALNKELVSGGLTISAIPEPAVWGMMFLGMGAMGGMLRRRRSPALSAA